MYGHSRSARRPSKVTKKAPRRQTKREQQEQKLIMLCVAGLTPQIITETLYVLTQEEPRKHVEKIRVITTVAGQEKLLKVLLDRDSGKYYEFCSDFGIDPTDIEFNESTISLLRTPDGTALPDIRTLEENEFAGDSICRYVRQWTQDPGTPIHASVAGGRKTMGIYLTAAFQLFARPLDTLSHVLVNDDFEGAKPTFYYKPPRHRTLEAKDGRKISTKAAQIFLAEIPFVRLRGLLSDKLDTAQFRYSDLVRQTQEDLNLIEVPQDVTIDLRERTVTVGSHKVRLTEPHLFIYTLFAIFRQKAHGKEGFVALSEICEEDLDNVFRRIMPPKGRVRSLADIKDTHPKDLPRFFKFVATLRTFATQTTAPDVLARPYLGAFSKIKRAFNSVGAMDRYLIDNSGPYRESRYGLSVPPDRIVIT